MEISRIIIKPYLTEKSYTIRNLTDKEVLTFIVDRKANKNNVKEAFNAIYGVDPEKVNIHIKKPARIRTGTAKPGYSKLQKVAYITLPKGVKIAVTKEEIEESKEAAAKEKK